MANPYDSIIAQAEQRYKLPPGLLGAVIKQESGYNPRAVSPVGAQGLAQLMPATARGLGVTDPFDPVQSVQGGAQYLADQLRRFGSPELALAAYNAGPGNVEKYGGVPPFTETRSYVRNVLAGVGRVAGNATGPALGAPEGPRVAAVTPPPAIPTQSPLANATVARAFNANNRTLGLPPLNLSALQSGPVNPTPTTIRRANKLKVEINHDQPVSPLADPIVTLAKRWLGTPYSWGGGSPAGPTYGVGRGAKTKGFDCSSFAQFLYAQEGVRIPRVTYDQWKAGQPVQPGSPLAAGDLVFFHPGKRGPEHVGIYIGSDQFIEAPRTGLTVRISKLSGRNDYMGARRFGSPT